MALAASLNGSFAFSHARRLTETVQAFFGTKESDTKKSRALSGIEKDLVDISPYNQVKQKIAQFKSQTNIEASLKMSLTTMSETVPAKGSDPLIDKDIDMMLRMISEDEDEYLRLRQRYEDLISSASESFSSSRQNTIHQSVETQSGRQDPYRINLNFEKLERTEAEITLESIDIEFADPLVLDLTGEGIQLTRPGEGATFDITADGKLNETAWVKGGTGILVYDRNGNGIIDDGSEMFGDQNGKPHGFAELAKYDSNNDGRIDRLDPIFKSLRVYKDINENGKIDDGELFTLEELGIKALNLDFVHTSEKVNGNPLILRGSFERTDGTTGEMSDVLLGYR